MSIKKTKPGALTSAAQVQAMGKLFSSGTGAPNGWLSYKPTGVVPTAEPKKTSSKPKCKLQATFLTSEETNSTQPYVHMYGGKTADSISPSTMDEVLEVDIEGKKMAVLRKDLRVERQHQFVDTGMQWTYCKVCDCEGRFDPSTGKYSRKTRAE